MLIAMIVMRRGTVFHYCAFFLGITNSFDSSRNDKDKMTTPKKKSEQKKKPRKQQT